MPNKPAQDIFAILGLQALPRDEKVKLLQKIEVGAREQVINKIVSELDEAALEELSKMMKEETTEEQVIVFLKDKIPQLEDLIRQEVEHFKNTLIQEVHTIRQEIESAQQPASVSSPAQPSSKELKIELSKIEKDLDKALKEGAFDRVHDLTQRSKELKKRLTK
jgi:uncharacterized protein YehS (DUF1456 family)